MLGNKSGGEDVPFFQKKERLAASKLNTIVDMIIRSIKGTDPVTVRSVPGGVVVGLSETWRRPRPMAVPAKVKAAESAGSYLVDTYEDGYSSPAGRANLVAFPIDDSVALTVDQKVTMISTRTKNFLLTGGGGAGVKCFLITVNHDDGTYDGLEYDEPEGSIVGGSGADTVLLKEDNGSVDVPIDQWVRGYPGAGTSSSPDFWFSMPFGCSS